MGKKIHTHFFFFFLLFTTLYVSLSSIPFHLPTTPTTSCSHPKKNQKLFLFISFPINQFNPTNFHFSFVSFPFSSNIPYFILISRYSQLLLQYHVMKVRRRIKKRWALSPMTIIMFIDDIQRRSNRLQLVQARLKQGQKLGHRIMTRKFVRLNHYTNGLILYFISGGGE